jgi:periplasmic copper chaperone A
MRKFRFFILAATCAIGGASAWAHVTATPNEAPAGTYFRTAFTVPHGCNGSPTVAVRIKIPDGVMSVKPQMKPGWEVTITNRKLDKSIDAGHGKTVTETVDEVAWRGGPLPDSLYDTFGLMMKLPNAPGRTLYFPVIQECKDGVHRWITIPAAGQDWGDAKEPAPFVKLKTKGS